MGYKIAVVGASGLVGSEIIKVLESSSLLIDDLICIASEKSVGKTVVFKNKTIKIGPLLENSFDNIDIVFLAAGSKVSKVFAPIAKKAKAIVIDSSSYFRMDDTVPLIIPEINPEALINHTGIIASPNCTTSIMLMPLSPLHKAFKIKRIVAATYQAVSGGGYKLINALLEETQAKLNDPNAPTKYGFNVYLHDSPIKENRYTEEELKMGNETRKILNDPKILVTSTCVRVPIIRAHSVAINVEFRKSFTLEKIYEELKKAKGVKLLEDFTLQKFPTPLDATNQKDTLCGRLRLDLTQKNTLELWAVGDQLLKGAALNAVQIAEKMDEMSLLKI
ncbi:MAG: aspartate-semialdehyde dehydrogenase [Chlamydiae bacterium]|nr:aspartate-semialdehyde dehydrogenase [Chlamydiota bacterium]